MDVTLLTLGGVFRMTYGIWYGVAFWFLILKGFHVQPFEEWSWWSVMVPIILPSYPEIMQMLWRQDPARLDNPKD